MKSSEFMKAIPDATRVHLPPALSDFRWQSRPWLVKIYYGAPSLHYEVSSFSHRNLLELGLHLENRDSSVNTQLLDYFDARVVRIKAELGQQVEAEQWDKGWAKVYETLPLEPLERPYLERVATRLAQLIVYLNPILVAAKNKIQA